MSAAMVLDIIQFEKNELTCDVVDDQNESVVPTDCFLVLCDETSLPPEEFAAELSWES